MSAASSGPVRVRLPLSTAVSTAPQAYYTHSSPLLQGRREGAFRRAFAWTLCGVEFLEARHRFYVSGGRPPGGGSVPTPTFPCCHPSLPRPGGVRSPEGPCSPEIPFHTASRPPPRQRRGGGFRLPEWAEVALKATIAIILLSRPIYSAEK